MLLKGLLQALVIILFLSGCDGSEQQTLPASGVQSSQSAAQTEDGTRRMAQRLDLLAENASPMENSFLNHSRLNHLLSLKQEMTDADTVQQFNQASAIALEQLRSGRSEQAADSFSRLLDRVRQNPDRFAQNMPRRLRALKAIALMRQGEQSNCVALHMSRSCIFPIDSAAVHINQEGSRAAMVELASLLEEFPDDLTSRWLYNLAAQTIGEYPDRVPARWLIPAETFDSEYPLNMFTNAAPATGLAAVGLAGGAVMDDFNGDGHLDVMASSWGYRDALRLLINQSDGQFTEDTQDNGLNGITGGLNLVHADFDNDGDPDVFVLRGAWLLGQGRQPNSLLVNDGAGHFTDQTEQAGLLSFHPTQTAAWGDYDNDGWIDLVIGNEIRPGSTHPGELYRNNGDGTFSEVADQVGLRITGFVKAVVWGDYNNDGWIDLYVSRMGQTNQLFRNNGPDVSPQFNDVTELAGVAEPVNSFPAWFWDMDNDGWLDLFVADFSSEAYGADRNSQFVPGEVSAIAASYLGLPSNSTPRVYRNRQDGTFEDITQSTGLDLPLLAMGVNYGDIDNDGYPDMYIGTGDPDFQTLIPNRMFRNDEGLAFQDVTTSAGVGHLQKGHGIAFGDLDNDGDQDVYAVMGGAYSGDVFQNAMFLNPGNDNSWVTIRLQGVNANRSAIGARLRLDCTTPDGRRSFYKLVGSGGSFGANSLQLEIGLGQASRIDRLTIEWPGASTQVFTNIDVNQTLLIVEGEPEPRVLRSESIEMVRH